MLHNENTRVKIPTILHLKGLGNGYLSLKDAKWDDSTHIFTDIFNKSIKHINPDFTSWDVGIVNEENLIK
jgi:type I restriction enzyme R subunit